MIRVEPNFKRIVVVRHGESEGNKDKSLFDKIPDHKFELTDAGRIHAKKAGEAVANSFDKEAYAYNGSAMFISPMMRTIQTAAIIDEFFVSDGRYEDPRLRERSMGYLVQKEKVEEMMKDREKFGKFWYPFARGDSGVRTYDRVSSFMDELLYSPRNDFDKELAVLVTHSYTMRVIMLYMMRWDMAFFENLAEPGYADWYILDYRPDNGVARRWTIGTSSYELLKPDWNKKPDFSH